MKTIRRSALVPYSADKMYDLVADVPRYPEFLRWCSRVQIVSEDEGEVIAKMVISFKGLHKSFATRNRMDPGRSIEMSLVEGPFRSLYGIWRFTPVEIDASKIELDMRFDFDSVIMAKLVGPVFSFIANQQVEAFTARARQIYGAG